MNRATALMALLFAVVSPRLPRTRTRPHLRDEWRRGFRRRSDVEFRQLLERLPAAAYTCDTDGLITYYNERAVELWGRAPELNDEVDRWCGSFRLYSADGSPINHDACWMALALRDNEGYNGQEIMVEREDGQMLTVLAHANPLHDRSGRVIGAVNVLVDISDRKRVENVLKEADRAKDEFLAMLAHELRNPLAPMHAALELMRRSPDEEATGRARLTLDRQLNHLTRVVDDLLDLSRISRNTLDLRLGRAELASVVHQSVEIAKPLAESEGQELEVSLPEDPVYVLGDPVRLAQAFSNLLNNACKYTPPGGRVELTVERQGSDVMISVRDNGAGIDPAMLPTIFELFVRGNGAAGRQPNGLGVGLTLARRIVELHGGSIEARSGGPGTGSEFRVRLPALHEAAESPAPTTAPVMQIAERVRVLVVDDNKDAAETIRELLELEGHDVHIAHDGAAAVESAEAIRPALVLMDIGLPKLNGYEAAREIRGRDWGSDVMLVALTGWGQEADRRRSREAGFDRHLAKPVEFSVLEGLLAEIAAERRQGVTKG